MIFSSMRAPAVPEAAPTRHWRLLVGRAVLLVVVLGVAAPAGAAEPGPEPFRPPEETSFFPPLVPAPTPGASGAPTQLPAPPADPCDDSGNPLSRAACQATAAAGRGILDLITTWVVETATQFVGSVARLLDTSTAPQLRSGWFLGQYGTMIALAAAFALPLLLATIIDGLVHGTVATMLRAAFLALPLAALGTAAAVPLVDAGLAITDWACVAISSGTSSDAATFLEGMIANLSELGGTGGDQFGAVAVPGFGLLLLSVIAVFAALVVWIELLLREQGIYLVTFFFPLTAATMIWPRVARWFSRGVRTLFALVISKFFVVAVISLAGAAMAQIAGGDSDSELAPSAFTVAAAEVPDSEPAEISVVDSDGFTVVISGVALLAMAMFAPWVCFNLLSPIDGATAGMLEGAARRPTAALDHPSTRTLTRAGGSSGGAPAAAAAAAGGGPAALPLAGAAAAGSAASGAKEHVADRADALGDNATPAPDPPPMPTAGTAPGAGSDSHPGEVGAVPIADERQPPSASGPPATPPPPPAPPPSEEG